MGFDIQHKPAEQNWTDKIRKFMGEEIRKGAERSEGNSQSSEGLTQGFGVAAGFRVNRLRRACSK